MNSKQAAVLYGETDTELTAEWSDRALDDDDRYADDSVFIRVSVPKEQGRGALNARLYEAYDRWIKERN